jgi:hypothetical protein
MKYTFLFILLFPLLNYGQNSDEIILSTIQEDILLDINNQGMKLFKKSDCYNKKELYFSVPDFFVNSITPLEKLTFSNNNTLLANLFVTRSSKKTFTPEIYWNFFLKRNPYVLSSSDYKWFYCYNLDSMFIDVEKSSLIDLNDIYYIFHMYNDDLNITFLVDKKRKVFVHLQKEKQVLALHQFNKLYQEGKIEQFTSNPFEDR